MDQVRGDRIVAIWHLEDFAGLIAQLSAPELGNRHRAHVNRAC
jgi:hypothetical protein